MRNGNRYEVGVLWKNEEINLPNNRDLAVNRFKSAETSLIKILRLRLNTKRQLIVILKVNTLENYPRKKLIVLLTQLITFPIIQLLTQINLVN